MSPSQPGRNDPCYCGSGKKYKKCHLSTAATTHPREMRKFRTRTTIDVPVDKIWDPVGEDELDPNLMPFISRFYKGRHPITATRLPLSKLTREYMRDGQLAKNRWLDDKAHKAYAIHKAYVPEFARRIISGERPSVYAYPDSARGLFVATDDDTILEAYTTVGISHVPVLLYEAKPSDLHFGGFLYSHRRNGELLFQGTAIPTLELARVPASGWSRHPNDVATIIQKMKSLVARQPFDKSEACDYRVSMYLAICRMERLWESASMLLAEKADHACIIFRSMYEATLLSYADWLSPRLMGDTQAMIGKIEHAGHDPRDYIAAAEQGLITKEGLRENDAREWSKARTKELQFLSNVKELSDLTPLRGIHSRLYKALSLVAHQAPSNSVAFLEPWLAQPRNAPTRGNQDYWRQIVVECAPMVMDLWLLMIESDFPEFTLQTEAAPPGAVPPLP